MDENPYQSPAANIGGYQSLNSGDGVSAEIVDQLARTRPWTLFVAVIGLIGVGFMVLFALLGFAAMSQVGAAGFGMLVGLIYLAIAAVSALPMIRLIQYSSAITQLRVSPNSRSLELAMDRQRSYWKTVGIMMIIGIVLCGLMMIASMSMAASTARSYPY